MSFGLYAIGFAILTIGLIHGAYLVHVPGRWIVVGAIVLIGAGILSGVKATDSGDHPDHLHDRPRHRDGLRAPGTRLHRQAVDIR